MRLRLYVNVVMRGDAAPGSGIVSALRVRGRETISSVRFECYFRWQVLVELSGFIIFECYSSLQNGHIRLPRRQIFVDLGSLHAEQGRVRWHSISARGSVFSRL